MHAWCIEVACAGHNGKSPSLPSPSTFWSSSLSSRMSQSPAAPLLPVDPLGPSLSPATASSGGCDMVAELSDAWWWADVSNLNNSRTAIVAYVDERRVNSRMRARWWQAAGSRGASYITRKSRDILYNVQGSIKWSTAKMLWKRFMKYVCASRSHWRVWLQANVTLCMLVQT